VSQYYELGGVTLWNPSNGVSRLFLRQVALFEDEVGVSSGIGPMVGDEAQISAEPFEAFVAAVLAWRGQSNHAVLAALSDGLIATLVVLTDRAGVAVRWPGQPGGGIAELHDVQAAASGLVVEGGWEFRIRARARELAGFMAR
jgi:hypothetical protein